MNTVSISSPWLPQETHLEISIEPTCQAMHLVFGESISGIHSSNSHSSHLLSKSYVYSMYTYSRHIYFRTHYLYYLNLTCKFWKSILCNYMIVHVQMFFTLCTSHLSLRKTCHTGSPNQTWLRDFEVKRNFNPQPGRTNDSCLSSCWRAFFRETP